MNKENGFIDPYKDLDQGEKCRVQTWISRADHDIVASIRPGKGTIQVVNNTLWYEFIKALRRAGISGLEHKLKLESVVGNIKITFEKKGTK
jgi:hypothetical protein